MQKSNVKYKLFQKLTYLLITGGSPLEIFIESISTVSEIIRGCPENQSFFQV